MDKGKRSFDTEWDVDKYRTEFEPENHWQLRRKFMVAHMDDYPEDRLVSLAQLFINTECLGCRYPEKTMQLIAELSNEVAQNFREEQKGKLQRTMVGASDVAEARAKGTFKSKKQTKGFAPVHFVAAAPVSNDKNDHSFHSKSDFINVNNSVNSNLNVNSNLKKSTVTEKSHDKRKFIEENDIKKYNEALKILDEEVIVNAESHISTKESLQLHNVANHMKSQHRFDYKTLDSGEVECNVVFADQIVGHGRACSKKKAKNIATKNALVEIRRIMQDKLNAILPTKAKKKNELQNQSKTKTAMDLHRTNINQANTSRGKQNIQRNLKNQRNNSTQPLVFMLRSNNDSINYISLMHDAVTLSKGLLKYESDNSNDGQVKVSVIINNEVISSGVGETQKLAKENACQKAYEILKQSCYSVKVKHSFLSDNVIDQSNIVQGKKAANGKIDNENIGNKLLRMMGWQGGGLGKQEQGIEAPVGVKSQFKRSGLGHSDTTGNFKSKVDKLYENFIQGEYGSTDLVFSNEFSKEERETMHQLAHKYGLKSHSHGTGEKRHLVVSLKKTPWDIVQDLLQGKGEDKYELVEPIRNV